MRVICLFSTVLALSLPCLAQRDKPASAPASAPTSAPDPKAVAELIAQLGDSRAKAREAAQAKLQELGQSVRPAVTEALATATDAEAKMRLTAVLKALDADAALAGLGDNDFWARWPLPAESLSKLDTAQAETTDAKRRLRIASLLCPMRKVNDFDEEKGKKVMAKALAHLEANLEDPTIAMFAPEMGLTAILVHGKATKDANLVMVLLECVGSRPAYNGGLNVLYNVKEDKVEKVTHWGQTRERPAPATAPAK